MALYYTKAWDVSDEVIHDKYWPERKQAMAKATAQEAESKGWSVEEYWGSWSRRDPQKPFTETFEFSFVVTGKP